MGQHQYAALNHVGDHAFQYGAFLKGFLDFFVTGLCIATLLGTSYRSLLIVDLQNDQIDLVALADHLIQALVRVVGHFVFGHKAGLFCAQIHHNFIGTDVNDHTLDPFARVQLGIVAQVLLQHFRKVFVASDFTHGL